MEGTNCGVQEYKMEVKVSEEITFLNLSIRWFLCFSDTSKLKGEMAYHTFWEKMFLCVVVDINVEG